MKIINPIIDPNLNLTKKGFFYTSSFHNTVPVDTEKEPLDFTIERARSAHTFWIRQICEVT